MVKKIASERKRAKKYTSLERLQQGKININIYLCIIYFFSIKSYRLSFLSNAEYWKYFYCAFESFEGIEKYIFNKFENYPSSVAS